jgi:hypothetical protein
MMKTAEEQYLFIEKNKKKIFIGITIFIFIGILSFFLFIKNTNKEYHERRLKFPFLGFSDAVSSSIVNLSDSKGVSLISLMNKEGFALESSRNYNYKTFELCYFLEVNDSISKKKNSDTLFIFRRTQEYYFILGKEIGEKYKSKFYRSPN